MSKRFWSTPTVADKTNTYQGPKALAAGWKPRLNEQVQIGNDSALLTSSQGDFLASLSPLPGSEEAKQMTATSGQKCYASYERFIPNGSLRRMCQVLMTQPIWFSTQLHLIWRGSVTQRSRLKFRLVPLAPRTEGKECGLWPTVTVLDSKERTYYSKGDLALSGAVKIWPTPSSASQTGGHAGLAGGQGNRQKLYKMLGETEGKKMGSQQLNPNWVEWLMGFPLGWTALEPSETPSSRKSRKGL